MIDNQLFAKMYRSNPVHFPEAARNYPFQGRGFYKITGKVTMEFGVYSVIATTMDKVGY